MIRLTLLRHAKSSWDDSVPRDFERPLNGKGRRAALAVGRWMAEQGLRFDHVIASPAVRVMETLDGVAQGFGRRIEPEWDKRVYLASSATLLDLIRELGGEAENLLMVGHNPGFEDLVFDLVPDDGESPLRDTVEEKYPTGAVAEIVFDAARWADVSSGSGRLDRFTRPRDIDPALGPNFE